MINVGVVSYEDCRNFSLTGVFARCCGLKSDVRLSKSNSYSYYDKLKFKSFIGVNGDSFDRYLIRMLEMVESLNIVNFLSTKLIDSDNIYAYSNLTLNKCFVFNERNINSSMDDLILHFLK